MTAGPVASRTLESLRRDLEELDRAIVLLLAARVEAAHLAIEYRTDRGGDVTHPAQEQRVLDRARGWATDVGLSPTLVDVVFRSLIEEGKGRFRTQARVVANHPRVGEYPVHRRTRGIARNPVASAVV